MNKTINQHNTTSFYGFKHFKPTKVDDKLFRGCAIASPFNMYELKKKGVTQIIDLRNSAPIESRIEKFLCKLFGLKYLNNKFSHRQTTLPNHDFFDTINKEILRNDGISYINCEYGKHRTGLTVAIYEKLHTKKSQKEIIQNMINNGYDEMTRLPKSKKDKNYINLYQQLMERYFKK